MTSRPLDWQFANPEQDVEVAVVGPDDLTFIVTLWHPVGYDRRASVTVDRDMADVKANEIVDRKFDSVPEARAWAEHCFGIDRD